MSEGGGGEVSLVLGEQPARGLRYEEDDQDL